MHVKNEVIRYFLASSTTTLKAQFSISGMRVNKCRAIKLVDFIDAGTTVQMSF